MRRGADRGARAAALALASLVFAAGAASAAAGTGQHKLAMYSVAMNARYLNNGDDRGRGIHDNPFDDEATKLRPAGRDRGEGPFPGDVAVFTFTLYSGKSLQNTIGSVAYTCYYNYRQHALCE